MHLLALDLHTVANADDAVPCKPSVHRAPRRPPGCARPVELASCGSSVSGYACSTSPSSENPMPPGIASRSLPFDPGPRPRRPHIDLHALRHRDDLLAVRDIFTSRSRCRFPRLNPRASRPPDPPAATGAGSGRLEAHFHTLHSTSPPTPAFVASRPVITPREVVRMLVPRPGGHQALRRSQVDAAAWTTRPLEPVIARSPRGRPSAPAELRLDALAGTASAPGDPRCRPRSRDTRDFHLQPGRRHVITRLAGDRRVADARQHVCDRVGHRFLLSVSASTASSGCQPKRLIRRVQASLTPAEAGSGKLEPRYQLLFVTPATSPWSASLRKQSRHRANFRRSGAPAAAALAAIAQPI